MTTRQQKLKERENRLLRFAFDMISAEGFFNLRMSDVAIRGRVSVGTLYAHFGSKEDLLIGIAVNALRERYELFSRVKEKYESPVICLSALMICDHILNEKIGEISEIERLAQFPSVWKRASYWRMEEMNQLCQEVGNLVRVVIESALTGGELIASNERVSSIVTCINASAWGVCVGMHHVFNSYCVKSQDILTKSDIRHAYIEAVHALLRGFGYRREDFKDKLYEIMAELEIVSVRSSRKKVTEEMV